MWRVALLALTIAGCRASPTELAWRFTWDAETTRERAVAVEVALLRGGCDGEHVYDARISREGGDVDAPPELAAGRYGLAGTAIGEDCREIAAGCVEVVLPDEGREAVIELAAVERAARCRACSEGVCVAPTDASIDADIDADLPDGDLPDRDVPDVDALDATVPDATSPDADATVDDAMVDVGPPMCTARPCASWDVDAYLKLDVASINDVFGHAVAISDDGATIAVGAYRDNGDDSSDAGSVAIYRRVGDVWSFDTRIVAGSPDSDDWFGSSVALSGDGSTLAVGAPQEDSSANGVGGSQTSDSRPESGAVYVFRDIAGTWIETAYVKATNTGIGDRFGTSVALSLDGSTLVVGAPQEDGADETQGDSGAAYVYTRGADELYSAQAVVRANNAGGGDNFGASVDVSADGNVLIAGAPREDTLGSGTAPIDNDGRPDSGAAYVARRTGTSWAQRAFIKATDGAVGDRFGEHVAISGDAFRLAVAAPFQDGSAIGVDGVDGALEEPDSGAVYLYDAAGSSYVVRAYVKSTATQSGDAFGSAIDLSSDNSVLVVGAAREDGTAVGVSGTPTRFGRSESGAVFVYRWVEGTWGLEVYAKAAVPDVGDELGCAVAASFDGAYIAAGARYEDSAATRVGGDATSNTRPDSGAVYVFMGAR